MSFEISIPDSLREDTVPDKPGFLGPFRKFDYILTINQEKGVAVGAIVYSNGKRSSHIRYLKNKYVYANLSKLEFEIFLSLKEIMDNPLWVAILTKVSEGTSMKSMRPIMEMITKLGYEKVSKTIWNGMRSMSVEYHKVERALRRVPKYSGYVRNISALGSKSRNSMFIEPCDSSWRFSESENFDSKKEHWLTLLTVGEINFFSGRVVVHPEDDQTRSKQ